MELFLTGTGLVVKGVLLLLIIFSVISWAIIMFKFVQIHKAFSESGRFMDFFWKTKRFETISAQSDRFANSPLVALFKEGYIELRQVMEAEGIKAEQGLKTSPVRCDVPPTLKLTGLKSTPPSLPPPAQPLHLSVCSVRYGALWWHLRGSARQDRHPLR